MWNFFLGGGVDKKRNPGFPYVSFTDVNYMQMSRRLQVFKGSSISKDREVTLGSLITTVSYKVLNFIVGVKFWAVGLF